MTVHFFHRRVRETVIILEEGNLPHPWCTRCNIMVPWKSLNGCHVTTTQCAKGAERKRRRLVEEELWDSAERAFQDYRRPLVTATSFK